MALPTYRDADGYTYTLDDLTAPGDDGVPLVSQEDARAVDALDIGEGGPCGDLVLVRVS